MASAEVVQQHILGSKDLATERLATVSDIIPRIVRRPGDGVRSQIIAAIRLDDGGVREAKDYADAGEGRISADITRLWNFSVSDPEERIDNVYAYTAFNENGALQVYAKTEPDGDWAKAPAVINDDPKNAEFRQQMSDPVINSLGLDAMNHDRKGEEFWSWSMNDALENGRPISS